MEDLLKTPAPVPALIIIMGVSGSGKTTIGQLLAGQLHIAFFDADDFHSDANRQKMKSGQPLTDEDRAGWLQTLNELSIKESATGVVIACSALKEDYRQKLVEGVQAPVYWVYLKGDYQLIRERMQARKSHYMPPGLLQSQFETLEPPADAIVEDIRKTPEEIVQALLRKIPG